MTGQSDGGAAFPMPASEHSQGGHFEQYGMSLRDYFAATAMGAMLGRDDASPSDLHEGFQTLLDFISTASYRAADAMLKARAAPRDDAPQELDQ